MKKRPETKEPRLTLEWFAWALKPLTFSAQLLAATAATYYILKTLDVRLEEPSALLALLALAGIVISVGAIVAFIAGTIEVLERAQIIKR